jgi:serine/threonine protein kinase
MAAKWKTNENLDVAVKTAKPTNNIDYFKAMLSEVKIMIYLGEAANVVNLLGVCTQDIHSRILHIVLEFCVNGSLQNLLQKSRPNFVNLLEDYCSIGQSGDDKKREECVTTLDLIRWSAEIANGMNCLSMKRVSYMSVHFLLLTQLKRHVPYRSFMPT